MAAVAEWKIHKGCKGNLSQLEFLRFIVTVIMKTEDAIINGSTKTVRICKYGCEI